MKNVKEYVNAIEMLIDLEGIEIAGIANHKALETGLCNLEQFQAAARVIANKMLWG
jgi:hypothetical protein